MNDRIDQARIELRELMLSEFEPYPRDERNRYRIVVVKNDQPHTLASTETLESLGVALGTLAREGEFVGRKVGILDVRGEVGQRWLLNPWTKGSA